MAKALKPSDKVKDLSKHQSPISRSHTDQLRRANKMKSKPQIKVAKERERFCQDEEMVPTASASTSSDNPAFEVPTGSACTSATASTSVSTSFDDPAIQCKINPTEARTLRRLFRDFKARRDGILKALTTDVETFYSLCDPDKDDLCLYGHPNGTWDVMNLPEKLPPSMPEPTIGINFARDGKGRKHWLKLVAVHSDSWLLAVTFYSGCDLGKNSRTELFSMINNLPTIHEVVTGAAKKPEYESTPNKSNKGNKSASDLMPPPKIAPES